MAIDFSRQNNWYFLRIWNPDGNNHFPYRRITMRVKNHLALKLKNNAEEHKRSGNRIVKP